MRSVRYEVRERLIGELAAPVAYRPVILGMAGRPTPTSTVGTESLDEPGEVAAEQRREDRDDDGIHDVKSTPGSGQPPGFPEPMP